MVTNTGQTEFPVSPKRSHSETRSFNRGTPIRHAKARLSHTMPILSLLFHHGARGHLLG
jgi:hypothetical protein